MDKAHIVILKLIIAAAGGQSAFADALTRHVRFVRPDAKRVSQQRISKWAKGSAIDPALCPFIVSLAGEKGIFCALADLHRDADLIWSSHHSASSNSLPPDESPP